MIKLKNNKSDINKLLNDVCGHSLDNNQRKIVVNDCQNTLVIAGAGSGKTLTIIGKIRYLIEHNNINSNEILCISFTNESTSSLKNKLKNYYNYNIDVFTFHKLALNIIKKGDQKYFIADSDYLEFFIDEYFIVNKELYPFICKFFEIKENNFSDKILESFKKLVCTFIHLYKSNYSDFNLYKKIFKKCNKREIIFFKIVYQIHELYNEELLSAYKIDFDDMIHLATKLVFKVKISNYKYVIIDEYQDTSYIRYLLIKNILKKTNAKLLAVGDDFQSIYRFAGCNINIFLNFTKLFKKAKILRINNTYRNPMELINIAGKFIMKNKKQLRKKIYSNIHLNDPIKIVYYDNKKDAFKKLILEIYNVCKEEIMVLGRNNNDIYTVIDSDFILNGSEILYINNRDIHLKYYTIHKSKGLESSNVIIINMEDKILGFPSKLEDSKLFRFVLNKKQYPYEEERRLFYVALTRTKNRVYLLTPKNNPSIFINELKKQKI